MSAKWRPFCLDLTVLINDMNVYTKETDNKDARLGIFLWMPLAKERRRYSVTPSLIGREHIHNDPWH